MPTKPITVLDVGLHYLAFDSQAKAIKALELLASAKFVESKYTRNEWKEDKERSFHKISIQLNQTLDIGPELSKVEIVEPEMIKPKPTSLKKKQPTGGRQLLLESRQLRLK